MFLCIDARFGKKYKKNSINILQISRILINVAHRVPTSMLHIRCHIDVSFDGSFLHG